MRMPLTCFKAYDIRGKLGEELNEDIAYRIGRAYAQFIQPRKVVVGGDARLTSHSLKTALAKGLVDAGVDVIDLGMTGTEEIYFATSYLQVDGGIQITASHNPIDYNGMKMVREQSIPLSGDTGLREIQRLAEENVFTPVDETARGRLSTQTVMDAYVQHLLGYVDVSQLRPLRLVVNAGNGPAGHIIDALEAHLPFEFIKIHHGPDGTFPNGIPNPLLVENRAATADAVIAHKADMGIAWDGDFDRCFFFDERGAFVEGYYIVGLLAEAFLRKNPGATIIYDPRLTWNTQDIIHRQGGVAIQSKTGHAFIKEHMRQEDAVYGGEMSAHHYFKDFFYCDSGMIPWLLVCELVSGKGQALSYMLQERISAFPTTGEINCHLQDPQAAIERIHAFYAGQGGTIDKTDGLGIEFADWRFNIRMSNTEPIVRLNIESRADIDLLQRKQNEILSMLNG